MHNLFLNELNGVLYTSGRALYMPVGHKYLPICSRYMPTSIKYLQTSIKCHLYSQRGLHESQPSEPKYPQIPLLSSLINTGTCIKQNQYLPDGSRYSSRCLF
jgi:hypothetical protein